MLINSVTGKNWSIKLNGSTGAFQSSGFELRKQTSAMLKFSGKLNYSKRYKRDILKFQFTMLPELYRGNSDLDVVAWVFRSSFIKRTGHLTIIPDIYLLKRIYSNNVEQNAYDRLDLSLGLNFRVSSRLELLLKAGSGKAEIDSFTPFYISVSSTALYAIYMLNPKIRIKGGIYREWYKNDYDIFVGYYVESIYQDKKIGPELSFSFSDKIIVDVSYKLLKLNIDSSPALTSGDCYQHGLSGLIADAITKKITVMMFWSYVRNNIPTDGNQVLHYSPADAENKIRFQISYKLKPDMSLQLNAGYSRDRLIEDQIKLSGYQVTLGLEMNL